MSLLRFLRYLPGFLASLPRAARNYVYWRAREREHRAWAEEQMERGRR